MEEMSASSVVGLRNWLVLLETVKTDNTYRGFVEENITVSWLARWILIVCSWKFLEEFATRNILGCSITVPFYDSEVFSDELFPPLQLILVSRSPNCSPP